MPKGGSKPGERRGGRKKGTPNKTSAEDREAFRMVYERRLGDLDRWIKETGDGFQAVKIMVADKEIVQVPYIEKDPGKAADILTRMAEHFTPKLARIEKTIADASDDDLLAEVRRRAALKAQDADPDAR